jgi:hypothetical protein
MYTYVYIYIYLVLRGGSRPAEMADKITIISLKENYSNIKITIIFKREIHKFQEKYYNVNIWKIQK